MDRLVNIISGNSFDSTQDVPMRGVCASIYVGNPELRPHQTDGLNHIINSYKRNMKIKMFHAIEYVAQSNIVLDKNIDNYYPVCNTRFNIVDDIHILSLNKQYATNDSLFTKFLSSNILVLHGFAQDGQVDFPESLYHCIGHIRPQLVVFGGAQHLKHVPFPVFQIPCIVLGKHTHLVYNIDTDVVMQVI